jgi:salivary acidic proline-rich phosphoprotein 1/2
MAQRPSQAGDQPAYHDGSRKRPILAPRVEGMQPPGPGAQRPGMQGPPPHALRPSMQDGAPWSRPPMAQPRPGPGQQFAQGHRKPQWGPPPPQQQRGPGAPQGAQPRSQDGPPPQGQRPPGPPPEAL